MDYQERKVTLLQHAAILLFVLVGSWLAIKDYRTREQEAMEFSRLKSADEALNQAIPPIPLVVKVDDRKVRLGERLYHDPLLSHDGTISCASCHDLKKGGTDQAPTSTGIGGALGPINAPTTFNSGFFFSQFWDGRARDLAGQAAGPVQNPREMGSTWPEVISKLSSDKSYVEAFASIYSDGVQGANVTDAIAEYEKSLITPDSRFDRYLRGDPLALSADEKEGYRLFKEFGCVSCHQGMALGGNMYQTLGTMEDYFTNRKETQADYGRFNVTGNRLDLHQFKVPTLRNVERTFPYLHDGSAQTLEDVLDVMWKSQLGRSSRPEESVKIVKFLKTLNGKYKGGQL
ncbi:MAG TPA: cytochrome-c peroxidase [Anaeromyxobacteraceae bacterium]|nr:cytochrome-c peroxidase [Anaeromyxobacteraceae bacterium]